MSKENIILKLQQIKGLIESCLAELSSEVDVKKVIEKRLPTSKVRTNVKIGLKNLKKGRVRGKKIDLETPVKNLLNEGFFSDWRKDIEVCQKLKEKILVPRALRRSSITNVLRRLFAKGLLTRKEIMEGKKNILVYKEKKAKK